MSDQAITIDEVGRTIHVCQLKLGSLTGVLSDLQEVWDGFEAAQAAQAEELAALRRENNMLVEQNLALAEEARRLRNENSTLRYTADTLRGFRQ